MTLSVHHKNHFMTINPKTTQMKNYHNKDANQINVFPILPEKTETVISFSLKTRTDTPHKKGTSPPLTTKNKTRRINFSKFILKIFKNLLLKCYFIYFIFFSLILFILVLCV